MVKFYHGRHNTSQVVGGPQYEGFPANNRLTLTLPQRSDVCVRLINPHPVNYRYSLLVEIDSTEVKLPDLGVLLSALLKLRSAGPTELRSDPVRQYRTAVTPLFDEITEAQQAVDTADVPEILEGSTPVSTDSTPGFIYAIRTIERLTSASGHFNDDSLQTFLEGEFRTAEQNGATPMELDMLEAYGAELLSRRDGLRKIGHMDREQSLCHRLGTFPTTLTLTIEKVPARKTKAHRDVGPEQLVMKLQPYYERATVELVPTASIVIPLQQVDQFVVQNDTLRVAGKKSAFPLIRAGLMLTLNPWQFGATREFGLGFGFGVGFLGEGQLVSDVTGGVLLSWRNLLSLGFGGGMTQVQNATLKQGVPGLGVGLPLPDGTSLNDALDSSWEGALYLILSISGFDLTKK